LSVESGNSGSAASRSADEPDPSNLAQGKPWASHSNSNSVGSRKDTLYLLSLTCTVEKTLTCTEEKNRSVLRRILKAAETRRLRLNLSGFPCKPSASIGMRQSLCERIASVRPTAGG
jgi:hypothetical protein